MTPRTLILKLTSFCNINCSYCYMFNMADRSFEHQPLMLDAGTAIRAVRQLTAALNAAGHSSCDLVLHGGEPTLWPLASFEALLKEVQTLQRTGLAFRIGLQTNLIKPLSSSLMALLDAAHVEVGVSLDGPAAVNDRSRVDHAGRGTYDKVLANVERVIRAGHANLLGGFLCVMQPEIDPGEFVDWVASLPIPAVNLLWPMQHSVMRPPWTGGSREEYLRDPLLGRWLQKVFAAWLRRDDPGVHITLFEDAIRSQLGDFTAKDVMGGRAFGAVVLQTDGTYAGPDYFRAHNSAPMILGNVDDGLDRALQSPLLQRQLRAASRHPQPCLTCEHVAHCSGGAITGRIDQLGRVVARPSVLCVDHKALFDDIAQAVRSHVETSGPTARAHA